MLTLAGLVNKKTVRYGQKMETTLDIPAHGKSERRRQAILDVASELFRAQGYAATSMSEIAARLGGSKGTLYNYFRSKEDLFQAFMVENCKVGFESIFDSLKPVGEDMRSAMIELGVNFLTFVLKPDTLAIHRLVVAEVERFPELGSIFYETGPKRGEAHLAQFFAPLIAEGRLKSRDPAEMARWYKDLMMSDIFHHRLWGVIEAPTPSQIRAHVTKAVDVFLAAFG